MSIRFPLRSSRGSRGNLPGTTRRILPFSNPFHRPTLEEVQTEGDIVFRSFLEELLPENIREEAQIYFRTGGHEFQFQARDVPQFIPESAGEVIATARTGRPEGYSSSEYLELGRRLRELADEFGQTEEARRVQELAEDTPLDDLTERQLWSQLDMLFIEGFSRQRVILIFYYCSLLFIRSRGTNENSSRRTNNVFVTRQLYEWSQNYIRNRICPWVYEQGGWGRVLGRLYDVIFKVAAVTLLIVGIACGIAYIRKNL